LSIKALRKNVFPLQLASSVLSREPVQVTLA
jgi:hypothetical protein